MYCVCIVLYFIYSSYLLDYSTTHSLVTGDPYQWTDATGYIRRDIHNIRLPLRTNNTHRFAAVNVSASANSDTVNIVSSSTTSDWEWVDEWGVDTEGESGEIDNDGWEYASSFHCFGLGE